MSTFTYTMTNFHWPASEGPLPTFYKLLRKDFVHHGFKYKTGFNELPEDESFTAYSTSGPGGLYFCDESQIHHWITMYDDIEWIARITLWGDSQWRRVDTGYKTDKLILESPEPVTAFLSRLPDLMYKIICANGLAIRYIRGYSSLFAMSVVAQNGMAIQYITNPDEEVKYWAVTQNGLALRLISDPSLEICEAAIRQCGTAIEYVPIEIRKAHPELCEDAVRKHGWAIRYLEREEQTPRVCELAIRTHPSAAQWIKK